MSKYHDDSTQASDPGGLTLARDRLKMWPRPGSVWAAIGRRFFGDKFAEVVDEHMGLGDSRAAVVLSRVPLLVAAYTDELDCVAILDFPVGFAERFGLDVGTRLLTVNTYGKLPAVAADLVPGPADYHRYQNFYPLIAEFLCESRERIAARKAEIAEAEWERCAALGREYITRRPGVARNGSPFASAVPAKIGGGVTS